MNNRSLSRELSLISLGLIKDKGDFKLNKFQIDDKLISSQELFSYFFNQEHNSSIIKDDSNRFIFLDKEKVYTKINKF